MSGSTFFIGLLPTYAAIGMASAIGLLVLRMIQGFSAPREDAGAGITEFAADGLTLLAGNERIYPADYLDADVDHHLPLTELRLLDHLKAGTTTVCVVWPDPGGDTITLDHPEGKYSTPNTAYRLTDIPIKNS